MLAGILLIPIVYVVICGYEYYPPNGNMLEDPEVAELLDLDISAGIPLMGYFAGGVRSPLFYIININYFNFSTGLLERPYELRVILYNMHLHGGVRADGRFGLANASFRQVELSRTLQQ